jgi:hypothetical protein
MGITLIDVISPNNKYINILLCYNALYYLYSYKNHIFIPIIEYKCELAIVEIDYVKTAAEKKWVTSRLIDKTIMNFILP